MNRNIVLIGASAGGVPALKNLLPQLPKTLDASVFIVMHMSREGPRLLADICNQLSDFTAAWAADGETLHPGRIYFAPPDRHLTLDATTVRVVFGPKENRFRPAIDALFRSAAAFHGKRVVGVILSGYLDDGVSGLVAVKSCGGISLVQLPEDAVVPDLPHNVLAHMHPDHVATAPELARLIVKATEEDPTTTSDTQIEISESVKLEVQMTAQLGGDSKTMDRLGVRSDVSCPECGGPLWKITEGHHLRYRCHIGHAYTAAALSLELEATIERALNTSLRSMEESARIIEEIAAVYPEESSPGHRKYKIAAEKAREDAVVLRRLVRGHTQGGEPG